MNHSGEIKMGDTAIQSPPGLRPKVVSAIWAAILLAWFLALALIPDPRPLSAPDWSVTTARRTLGVSEPQARMVATVATRGVGIGLIGILTALWLGSGPLPRLAPLALIVAPVLGLASQWINYGYFPIYAQVQLIAASGVLGALAGLALRCSRIWLVALITLGAALFVWGTSNGIREDLNLAARATALHVMDNLDDIGSGDDGFAQLLQSAFTFAEDNSHGTDAVYPNQAAILALAVILGEEKVAEVAGRPIELGDAAELRSIRRRITLRGQRDLARHFWVSAGLAILSDENRSLTVGIGKELMDATPGGSGFSFVDLAANRAGILFAEAATGSAQSAYATQMLIQQGISSSDFLPNVDDLPEGLTRDQFHNEYGGLGGAKTREIVDEIRRRLATCRGLSRKR